MSQNKARRKRRSSSIVYTEPPESLEHISDQAALPNLNAEWVNAKGASKCAAFAAKDGMDFQEVARQLTALPTSTGAWAIHFVVIVCLKIGFNLIPGISPETSWTLTNLVYMVGSYIMFHWVRGVPFDFNAGAYDNLNMWEQIDNGDQYTPAKKFLLSVPVVLFLVSTHYTHYDLTYFLVNFFATLAVVVPKLPAVSGLSTEACVA